MLVDDLYGLTFHPDREGIGPLQLSHHMSAFHKIMSCNFRNARNGKKACQKIKMAKFDAPGFEE